MIAASGVGFLVMLLWNSLMPPIFGLPSLTFMQALGLLVLSRLLFGGFPNRGGASRRRRWKARMQKKWERMSPEERKAFKEKMGRWRRRGCWPEENETEQTGKEDSEGLV